MMMDSEIKKILELKTVAVVGCSPNPERPSHFVAQYLLRVGYHVIPVNPGHREILGLKCYPNLLEVPEPVELVNIFRRSEQVYPIVQDAIRIGAKAVWMQDGIVHELAAQKAKESGLGVVMDNCIMREHSRQMGPFRKTITTC